ncbi:hypothetical protein BDR26DRAFT_874949 [Obelidium mucronatum]|nr:hypothetical protein BDR26DRAFT_874949 [Obelidium mucronatum]
MDSVWLQQVAKPINFILIGVCLESCLNGLFQCVPQLIRNLSSNKESPILVGLICIFNASTFLQMMFYAAISLPLNEDACFGVNFVQTLLWHISFCTFGKP